MNSGRLAEAVLPEFFLIAIKDAICKNCVRTASYNQTYRHSIELFDAKEING